MILITGGTGFIGCHLARALSSQGERLVIAGYNRQQRAMLFPWNSDAEACRIDLDVTDRNAVEKVICDTRPTEIYHLAAQSLPALSWKEPEHTMQVNVMGTINIFEAIKKAGISPRVFVACSSAEYGLVTKDEVPVREDHPLVPVHPYGVSKVTQDLLANQYFINDKIPCIRGRIFNTTGPGKEFDVAADLTSRVVDAEQRGESVIKVGNLAAERDLTDVRDMVAAIVAITRKGEPGNTYNICTSKVVSIQSVAEMLVSMAKTPLRLEADPELFRPTDEPIICGSNARLLAATGWQPRYGIQRTLKDMLAFRRGETVTLD